MFTWREIPTLGKGVARNGEEAAKWFRKGAGQGDSDAQFIPGRIYADGGIGIKRRFVAVLNGFSIAPPRSGDRD
jgi:TPR repeat protein